MFAKSIKNIFKFLLLTITMVVLVGCSSSNSSTDTSSNSSEVTKKYENTVGSNKVEITLVYTKDSDNLLRQENKVTTKIPDGVDKDEVIEHIKTIEKQYEHNKADGVSVTITSNDNNEVIATQTVDYTKLTSESASKVGIGEFVQEGATASLSKVETKLKEKGFKEVTN